MARQYITPAEFRAKPFGVALRQYSDPMLVDYIEIATANVETFTERIFAETTYTDTFKGDGSTTHLVYQYPITTIVSLDETTIEATPVVTAYDVAHFIRTSANDAIGKLEMDGLDENIFTFVGSNLYTVEYTAGFAAIPVAVKHATALWVSELIKPDYGGAQESVPEIVPLTSQQIGDLLIPLRRRRISGA